MTRCPSKKGNLGTQTHRDRRGPCEDGAKIGVTLPQAKACQQTPETRKRQTRILL